MATTHWRLKMSPILGQEKGPEDQKDPGTGAHSSSILADFPPVAPGSPSREGRWQVHYTSGLSPLVTNIAY